MLDILRFPANVKLAPFEVGEANFTLFAFCFLLSFVKVQVSVHFPFFSETFRLLFGVSVPNWARINIKYVLCLAIIYLEVLC